MLRLVVGALPGLGNCKNRKWNQCLESNENNYRGIENSKENLIRNVKKVNPL